MSQQSDIERALRPRLKREELIHYAITGSTWWGNARSTPLDVDPDTLLVIKAAAAGATPTRKGKPSKCASQRERRGGYGRTTINPTTDKTSAPP